MKAKNKTNVKALFDFVKKNSGIKKKTVEVYPGVKATLEYYTTFNGVSWDYTLEEEKISFPKDFKKLFVHIFGDDPSESSTCLSYDDEFDMTELDEQVYTLINKAEIEDEYVDWFETDMVNNPWTDWWRDFSDEFEDPNKKEPVVVGLNSAYKALIDKSKDFVEVGCQKIPISAVRAIIEEYDKA